VLSSDAKVHVLPTHGFVYPEARVVCGEIQAFDDHQDVWLNSALIIEVLGESTER
jgi:hypothetical protein